MLTDKQKELIERLVEGSELIQDVLKSLDISSSTYYYWRQNNKTFNDAYDAAIEAKVDEARKNIRSEVRKYIKRLDEISLNGSNENARVNAIAKILTLGNLDPQFKQEITIKSDDNEQKNHLLDLLNEQQKEEE